MKKDCLAHQYNRAKRSFYYSENLLLVSTFRKGTIMRKITLKNADKLQTIEITYDGFSYNGKQIQHGALLIVKGTMDFDIGGTDEAIDFIQTAVKANGFTAYDEFHHPLQSSVTMLSVIRSEHLR